MKQEKEDWTGDSMNKRDARMECKVEERRGEKTDGRERMNKMKEEKNVRKKRNM